MSAEKNQNKHSILDTKLGIQCPVVMTRSAHKYLFGRTEKNGEIWIFKILFLPQKHYLILILLNVNELIIDFFDKSFDNFYTLK